MRMFKECKSVLGFLVMLVLCVLVGVSCTAVDVMVDKSMLKSETETHAIYPSEAVTPVPNVDAVNAGVADVVARVQDKVGLEPVEAK